jgi:hypothetical protein
MYLKITTFITAPITILERGLNRLYKSPTVYTFIRIIYRYILVFVDRLIKIRYLVLIISIKIDEAYDAFY